MQMNLNDSGSRLMTYDRNGLLNIWDTEKGERVYSTRILRNGKFIQVYDKYNSFYIEAQKMDSLIGEHFLLSDLYVETQKYLKENKVEGKIDGNKKFIVSQNYPYKVLKIYDAETLTLQKSMINPQNEEALYYFSDKSDFITILQYNDFVVTYETEDWKVVDSFYLSLNLERHQIHLFEENCLLFLDDNDTASLYDVEERNVAASFNIRTRDSLELSSSHYNNFYLDVNRGLLLGHSGQMFGVWDMKSGASLSHSKHKGDTFISPIHDKNFGNIFFSLYKGSLGRYNYLDGRIEYYDRDFLKLTHLFLNQTGSEIVSIVPKEKKIACSLDEKKLSKPLETIVKNGDRNHVTYIMGNSYFDYGDYHLNIKVSSSTGNLEPFFKRIANVEKFEEFQLSPAATHIFAIAIDTTYFTRLNQKDTVHVIPERFRRLKYSLDQKSVYLSGTRSIEPPETPIRTAAVLDLSTLHLGEYKNVDDQKVWSDRTITPSSLYYHKPYYIGGSSPAGATFVLDQATNSVVDTILYKYWMPKYWFNDSLLLLINSFGLKIRNQNLKQEVLHFPFLNPNNNQSHSWKIEFCPRGKRFAIAKQNDGLFIYHASSNNFEKINDEHTNNITFMRFSENGRLIIFVNAELLITKYDLDKKEVVSRWLYLKSDDRILRKIMYP
jgi:hypothetical protein